MTTTTACSTCFLCLQKYHPSTWLPNALKNPEFEGSIKEEVEEQQFQQNHRLQQISLSSISRYLQLNIPGRSTTMLDEGGMSRIVKEVDGSVASVFMCQDCADVTTRLSNLCDQLELLELKVVHSLKMFHKKMVTVEVDDVRDEENYWSTNENNLGGASMRMFRRETSDKCKHKLESVKRPANKLSKLKEFMEPREEVNTSHTLSFKMQEFPFVKMETPMVENWSTHNHRTEAMTYKDEQQQQSSSFFESSQQQLKHSLKPPPPTMVAENWNGHIMGTTGDESHTNTTFSFQSSQQPKPSLQPSPSTSTKDITKLTCYICPNRPKFYAVFQLEMHQHVFHPDFLLASSRQPHITPIQFKQYCAHVLHFEGLLSKRRPEIHNDSSLHGDESIQKAPYNCQYCKAPTISSWRALRRHLLRHHKNTLARKVEKLQQSTSPEELKHVTLPPMRDDRKCEDCEATFAHSGNLSRHRIMSCKFRKDKSVTSCKPCKCPECGSNFARVSTFTTHCKNQHPGMSGLFPILL